MCTCARSPGCLCAATRTASPSLGVSRCCLRGQGLNRDEELACVISHVLVCVLDRIHECSSPIYLSEKWTVEGVGAGLCVHQASPWQAEEQGHQAPAVWDLVFGTLGEEAIRL